MQNPATHLEKRKARREYVAYGAARQLWGCKAEEILLYGGAGGGKSRSLLEKIVFCLMKYPESRALIVRQTRESMTESVLVTLEYNVIPQGSAILEGPGRNLRQHYTFPNGSELVVGGLDKPAKVMSTEYDIIGVFEATEVSEEAFESLTTRLRNGKMPYQQIVADCNPGAPSHWLNRRSMPSGNQPAKMTRLHSRLEDNPVWFDMQLRQFTVAGERYIKKLQRLTGVRRKRLYEGLWVAAEGQVYENFDYNTHVIKVTEDADGKPSFAIPADWRRVRAIDFGYTNPFVCLWGALDGDGRLYIYREIYRQQRLVSDHAVEIERYSRDERIEETVSDHDAEDRATLDACGITTVAAWKDVTPGIEAVKKRLEKAGDGRPRLYFLDNMLVDRDDELVEAGGVFSTIQEFDGYVWRKNADGTLRPKEEPVKKDDHGMDCLRYMCAYVDDLQGSIVDVIAYPTVIVR